MKFAAIDIGSNSIHLIIAEIYPDGHYIVIDKAKDMVGLASGTLADGRLSDEAIQRGLLAIKRFARRCQEHGVDAIEARATSAVREASNSQLFVDLVAQECDIDVEVISGEEEARLIYLGARDRIDWCGRRALIIDIGGGSVEYILGDESRAIKTLSLPLGVRRLSEKFLGTDPPRKSELKNLKAHILERIAPMMDMIEGEPFDFVVGTSGTLNHLAAMAARRAARPFQERHGLWTSLQELKEMGRALSGLTSLERSNYHGLGAKRADTIVAGAQLMKYTLRELGQDSYIACDYALRDGMVVDFVARQGGGPRVEEVGPSLRLRSARSLLHRFNLSGTHPHVVARLLGKLFDKFAPLHGMSREAGELLHYCALLHDIGRAIHPAAHSRHSAYIIEQGHLRGFTPHERRLMALIVKHHMADAEPLADPEVLALSEVPQRQVILSIALLRLADALDRARHDNVQRLSVKPDDEAGGWTLRAELAIDTGLEHRALLERAAFFTAATGAPLSVECVIKS